MGDDGPRDRSHPRRARPVPALTLARIAAAVVLLAAVLAARPAAAQYGVFLAGNDVLVGGQAELAARPACKLTGWGTDCSKTVGQVAPLRPVTIDGVRSWPTVDAARQAYCASIVPQSARVAGRFTRDRDWEARFTFDGQYHLIRNAPAPPGVRATWAGACEGRAPDGDFAIPALPLVIPAAELEGSLKATLVATRAEVLRQLEAAGKAREQRAALGGDGQTFDSVRFLVRWHDANRGVLLEEDRARQTAETFFRLLAPAYDRMTEPERLTVDRGLLDRALALRRYRTVQRGQMRTRAGLGAIASGADLDAYYTSVSRATWATLELRALVRMWGAVNLARVALHGQYDVHELAQPRPDPGRVAAIEAAQRRHLEALVDSGLAALLGSEVQFEASIEAQKDRLFGLRELWGQDGRDARGAAARQEVAAYWTRLGDATVKLFGLGLNLFDIAAGAGADAIKGGLYHTAGAEFRTRAEKLEQQAMQGWEKTQRKLLLLRLLRARSLADVRRLAEMAATGTDPATLPVAPGKIDADDLRSLMADRAFHEATDGGLLRLLSPALSDFVLRARLELAIARQQTRLIGRDMQAAYRVEQGQDPGTGELAWSTILSPTGWGDVVSKNILRWNDFSRRKAAVERKAAEVVAMERLEGPLVQASMDFEALPEPAWGVHARLWAGSAAYIGFVQRVRDDARARHLHEWRRPMPDLGPDPEAGGLRKFYEEMVGLITEQERRAERRRMLDLTYEDHVYAWDLGSALDLAEALRQDADDPAFAATYTARARVLREAVAWDRVKAQAIGTLRNVGDIGFFTAGFAYAGLAGGAAPTSFSRFVYEAVNPFAAARTAAGTQARAARAVFTQAATEVIVDLGVPATGQKYEALLNQIVGVLVDQGFDWLSRRVASLDIRARLTRAVEAERARHAELDTARYLADLLDRQVVRAMDALAAFGRRFSAARDPAVRQSIERQARDASRLTLLWMAASELAGRARQLRESLAATLREPGSARERLVAAYRDLEAAMRPPTRAYYERLLQTRPAELFDVSKGFSIERLRADFKAMRRWTRDADRPALDQLEARIDQERHARFARGLQELLAGHGGQITGVILNGTRPGTPEYKGLFSDYDFTIVVAEGAAPATIQRAADAAFARHGLLLNAPKRPPSADVEVMVQTFLPGEVRPIRTWQDFELWMLRLSRDPARYLTAGGAEWVGFYNYLSGATVSASGGQVVLDAVPDPRLLPPPELHPMLAHGLVLDNIRFDRLQPVSSLPDARTVADLIGVRAKYILRCADALIWALHPNLLRARTPQMARDRGYHRLLVDDARRLHQDGQLGLAEFQALQLLADVKAGTSVLQAMRIEPGAADASRARLEALWATMDGLVRRAYRETRGVYVDWLRRFASGMGDSPRQPELLATFALRNWNAARRVGNAAQPDKLAFVTGEPDTLRRMQREDQEIIGLGSVLDRLPAEPAGGMPQLDAHPPRDRSDERPAEGADPLARPTALETPPAPPARPPRAVSLEELFRPSEIRAYLFRGDGYVYVNGEKVGFVKEALAGAPWELVNEVTAFRLGRLLDANVPHTERVRLDNGEVVAVMRWVPGEEAGQVLKATIRGQDGAGQPPRLPAGLTREQFLARARAEFIRDRLLSAILGDHDRKHNNFIVTTDGHLVAIDHASARPLETDLSPDAVAAEMRKRFEGEGYPRAGKTDARSRQLDRELGVTWEEITAAWKRMRARLLDPLGNLNERALEALASAYGAQAPQVLATWKLRIAAMEGVVNQVFGAELRARYDLRPHADSGQPILFGQIGVSPSFSSAGRFKGAHIDEVVAKLKTGEYGPDDLPVEYIWVNGQKVVVNNRSLTTLSKAGLKPTKTVDMTGRLPRDGPDSLESVLQRLEEMNGQPSTSIPIRATDDRGAPARETVHLPR